MIHETPCPLRIAQALKAKGHRVIGHDPMMKRAPGLKVVDSIYEAASGARCIVLMSDAKEYRNIDWTRLRRLAPLAKIVEAAGGKVPSVFGRGTVHRLGGLS